MAGFLADVLHDVRRGDYLVGLDHVWSHHAALQPRYPPLFSSSIRRSMTNCFNKV